MSRPISSAPRRRDVLAGITAGLTASSVGCGLRDTYEPRPSHERRPPRRFEVDGPPLSRALDLARSAPSPHNTQPWRVRVDDEHRATLFVDPRRLLPQTDPPARQIHIGCGCFVEAFALAATVQGRRAEIELFPDGVYRGPHEIGRRPVARLVMTENPAEPHPLAERIATRQTSRLVYHGSAASEAELDRVRRAAAVEHASIRAVPADAMAPVSALVAEAMRIEFEHRPTNEETRKWFRFDEDEARRTGDGLTFEANGITGGRARLARAFTEDTAESWNHPRTIRKGLAAFEDGLESARAFVLLQTARNDVTDHVLAGRDCYRLMLALDLHGLACHPVNQVLQEYDAMAGARERFEQLVGTPPPGKTQMIFRIGRSDAAYLSHRRDLSSLVVKANRESA